MAELCGCSLPPAPLVGTSLGADKPTWWLCHRFLADACSQEKHSSVLPSRPAAQLLLPDLAPRGTPALPVFMVVDQGAEIGCWQRGVKSRSQPQPPSRSQQRSQARLLPEALGQSRCFGAGAPTSEAGPLLPTWQSGQRLARAVKAQTAGFKGWQTGRMTHRGKGRATLPGK